MSFQIDFVMALKIVQMEKMKEKSLSVLKPTQEHLTDVVEEFFLNGWRAHVFLTQTQHLISNLKSRSGNVRTVMY